MLRKKYRSIDENTSVGAEMRLLKQLGKILVADSAHVLSAPDKNMLSKAHHRFDEEIIANAREIAGGLFERTRN